MFSALCKTIKENQPVSTTGVIAQTYYWLKTVGSGDLVYHNPRFKPPKTSDPALRKGITIICTYGTFAQPGSFSQVAERLIDEGLPEIVSSIHLVSFDHRYQGKGIRFFARQLKDKIKENKYERVILIGHSRGCIINTYAAERYAEKEGIKFELVINLCGPFSGSHLAMRPLSWFSTSVLQMEINSDFLKELAEKVTKSTINYYFFAAENDAIVLPQSAFVPGYVEKKPDSFITLDRHGHLSIMSSHRLVSRIHAYISEVCSTLLLTAKTPGNQTEQTELAKESNKDELSEEGFILIGGKL